MHYNIIGDIVECPWHSKINSAPRFVGQVTVHRVYFLRWNLKGSLEIKMYICALFIY